MTSALASGGRQHFGWGVDRHLSADIYDAINLNTRATGQWAKGKAPKIPEWPRPRADRKSSEPKRVTVKDLWKRMSGRLPSGG